MDRTPARAQPGRLIARALRRRCPRCGSDGIFASYYRLRERCPHCGHRYDREHGYWVSAIIVNTAMTETLFGVLFVAGIFLTAPNVRWQPLLLIGVVTNVIFPLLFYPFSKTVWVGLDLYFNPDIDKPDVPR